MHYWQAKEFMRNKLWECKKGSIVMHTTYWNKVMIYFAWYILWYIQIKVNKIKAKIKKWYLQRMQINIQTELLSHCYFLWMHCKGNERSPSVEIQLQHCTSHKMVCLWQQTELHSIDSWHKNCLMGKEKFQAQWEGKFSQTCPQQGLNQWEMSNPLSLPPLWIGLYPSG